MNGKKIHILTFLSTFSMGCRHLFNHFEGTDHEQFENGCITTSGDSRFPSRVARSLRKVPVVFKQS